jgi:hypothetical protein
MASTAMPFARYFNTGFSVPNPQAEGATGRTVKVDTGGTS